MGGRPLIITLGGFVVFRYTGCIDVQELCIYSMGFRSLSFNLGGSVVSRIAALERCYSGLEVLDSHPCWVFHV